MRTESILVAYNTGRKEDTLIIGKRNLIIVLGSSTTRSMGTHIRCYYRWSYVYSEKLSIQRNSRSRRKRRLSLFKCIYA